MAQRKINRIIFIIDRSGSMQSIMGNAIDALNLNIEAVREQCEAHDQDATVSLMTFGSDIEMRFFNRPIGSIKPIGRTEIVTDGTTALFDATGDGINQLLDLPKGKDEDVSYLVNVITDGHENASKRFTVSKLKQLMQRVQATDLWTLSFLVPRGQRRVLVNDFGLPDGNVMEWDATSRGVKQYGDANVGGIKRFFGARAAGQTNIRSFYTDMTSVSTKEVRQLDDVTRQARVLDVLRDSEIRSFIESQGLAFVKGCAFYELVGGKDNADRVQDYKKVLIMENGKDRVYGGDEARDLLGLPAGTTKVRPGDHANFKIFIQSTSTNRKLRAGTRVIYMPSAAN